MSALEEIEKYGSDILRLWVASVNYQEYAVQRRTDRPSSGGLSQDSQHPAAHLLGNVDDFDPSTMSVAYADMLAIDQWAMEKLQSLIEQVHQAYEGLRFIRYFC